MSITYSDYEKYDVVIIGGGPVGLFSAVKFSNAKMKTLLLEASKNLGGQCIALYREKNIYNIPLFDSLTATELCEKLENQINKQYCPIKLQNKVIEIDENITLNVNQEKENEYKYLLKTDNNNYFLTKYIILACGNGEITPNKLPIMNIEQFENHSLLYEVKNKDIFKDKNVLIVGGGDSAVDWSIEISKIAKKLFLAHRRDIYRPDNPQFAIFHQLVSRNIIDLRSPSSLKSIIPDDNDCKKISKVELLNQMTNKINTLDVDYVLVFFGLQSGNSQILKAHNTTVQQSTMMTEKQNIFAVGDCSKYEGKIKIIPIGFAEVLKCFHYISQKEKTGINMYGKQTNTTK